MADISKIQIDGTTNDIVSKGMPSGGTTGQVLKKASGTDYDTEWGTASGDITIDTELDPGSGNPVANSTLTSIINEMSSDISYVLDYKLNTPTMPAGRPDPYYIGVVYDSESHQYYWGAKKGPVADEVYSSDDDAPSLNLFIELRNRVYGKMDTPSNIPTKKMYAATAQSGLGWNNVVWAGTDRTLTNQDDIADAKAVGDALALKANAADVHSVPSGGGAGQVLRKASATDYDLEWATPSGGGGGSEEVYWATYNVTTTDAIIAANAAGKIVAISYDDVGETYILTLQYIGDDDTCEFTCLSDATSTAYIEVTAPGGSGNWGQLGYVDIPQNNPLKNTTLTIATSDWSSLSCTKAVSGMTTTAVVWLEYSDTTTEFTCTQGTDALTFGCNATPSASVTVKVAFMEGTAV